TFSSRAASRDDAPSPPRPPATDVGAAWAGAFSVCSYLGGSLPASLSLNQPMVSLLLFEVQQQQAARYLRDGGTISQGRDTTLQRIVGSGIQRLKRCARPGECDFGQSSRSVDSEAASTG